MADSHVSRNRVIQCVADPQVKETRILAQIAARKRQTMPTEASHHIQIFNSCNPYTKESLATIQNGV